MHTVTCLSVPIDVDVSKAHSCAEVACFEAVDVDVRKRGQTYSRNHLLDMGPSMFATRT
jgi:hypothetical protein